MNNSTSNGVSFFVASMLLLMTAQAIDGAPPDELHIEEPGLSSLAPFAYRSVEFPNSLGVSIDLESVVLEVKEFVPHKIADPQLEILPFLDHLVVKLRNDGWRDFETKGIELFAPPRLAPEGRAWQDVNRVRRILKELRPAAVRQATIGEPEYYFFELAANAEPFGFHYGSIPLANGSPPRMRAEPPSMHVETTGGRREIVRVARRQDAREPGKFPKTVPRTPSSHRGAKATFAGTVRTTGLPIIKQYHGRKLQLVPLTRQEQYLSHVLDADLRGALYKDWAFAFGDYRVDRERYGFAVPRLFGATVRIDRKDVDRPRELPINVRIDDQNALKVELLFVSDQPVEFVVEVSGKYRVGTNPSQVWSRKKFVALIDFPRPTDVSWLETREFLAVMRERDGVLEQARKTLRTSLSFDDTNTQADIEQACREFSQAMLVVQSANDHKDAPLLLEAAGLVVAPIDFTDPVERNWRTRLLLYAFPLACVHVPDRAADFAIDLYLQFRGHLGLRRDLQQRQLVDLSIYTMSIALVKEAVRHEIVGKVERLRPLVAKFAEVRPLRDGTFATATDCLLACYLGLYNTQGWLRSPGVSGLEPFRVIPQNAASCMAFVVATSPDREIRDSLMRQLKIMLKSPPRKSEWKLEVEDDLRQTFECMTVLQFAELRDDATNWLSKNTTNRAQPDDIQAALEYVAAVGIGRDDASKVAPYLDYPYRSEIRELARKALNAQ